MPILHNNSSLLSLQLINGNLLPQNSIICLAKSNNSNFIPSSSPGGLCDFESADLCGYVTDREAELMWERGWGNAGNQPKLDHTMGTSAGVDLPHCISVNLFV